jgi:hypothetical protein
MVRFLTYSNQRDVEALIATTSVQQRDKTAASRIHEIIETYPKVGENLYLFYIASPGVHSAAPIIIPRGERVNLSAGGSTDPDGNTLNYEWIYYGEPGTIVIGAASFGAPFKIEDANQINAWFTAPKVTKPATMHIILAVTDQGSPALTRN